MKSLRRHILLGAAGAIAASFAVLAGILYVSVRAWLVAEFDRGLLAQAESLKAAAEFHNGQVRLDFDGGQPAQFLGGPDVQYFELWDSDRPVARSPSLAGRDLERPAPAGSALRYRFDRLPGDRAGRQIAEAFDLRRDPEEGEESTQSKPLQASLTLVVARDTSALSSDLARLRWLLAVSCGAALVLGVGLLAWIVRRGLRPVDAIAGRIAHVGRASLSDRLDADRVPRELLPIVARLNEMLARLESTFSRERAFTADVAHELRTPLAGLETSLEVCASRSRRPEEYQKVLLQCLDVTRHMHAMVDSLLTLARADAGTLAVSRQSFSLDEIVEESWKPFSDRAARRSLRFSSSVRIDHPMHSDRERIRQILHNVFDNAVAYADEGGSISAQVLQEANNVSLSVTNTGSRLSQEQSSHVFERFWRGDAARSETGAHCGLGLAITRELVAILGGTIEVTSSPGGEFCLRLTLPSATNFAEVDRDRHPARTAIVSGSSA